MAGERFEPGETMSNAPTTVIFDMDDVLCRYHFDKRLERLSEMIVTAEREAWPDLFEAPAAG